jgi:hypothetical protein
MKITLVGRPQKIIDRGQCIITTLESSKVPALPKGVPAPAQTATPYAIYIGSKQWKKVAEAITDPEDALIIEGFPQLDLPTKTIAVFTTSVTTKKIQAGKRQQKQELA